MSEPGSGWSDDRVELLKKLWAEGHSASQIAATMGGVTRNAVIGKVHRLGLSGRARSNGAATAQKPRKVNAAPVVRATVTTRAAVVATATHGNAALAVATVMETETVVTAPAVAAQTMAAPESQRVTIMELRENMCRWPMGDPTTADFCFCGNRTTPGIPYCDFHSRIAYQPPDRRRDRRN